MVTDPLSLPHSPTNKIITTSGALALKWHFDDEWAERTFVADTQKYRDTEKLAMPGTIICLKNHRKRFAEYGSYYFFGFLITKLREM
jgi:hypothetical protein